MLRIKVSLLLLIVLQSQFGCTFDGFLQSGGLHAGKYSLGATLLRGVSKKCNATIKSLDNNKIWQYFDSWGKPGSGILSGNVKWFGAFDQCISISDAKYCLVTLLGKFRTNETIPIWYGICLPDACDENDVAISIENFINNVTRRFFPTVKAVDISCYEEQSYTASVILTIIFCCTILICCLIGTTIEVWRESFKITKEFVHLPNDSDTLGREIPKVTDATETTPLIRPNKKQYGVTESLKLKNEHEQDTKFTTEDEQNDISSSKPNGCLVEFFLCFSFLRNSRSVFKTDVTPGTVTSLFGLRVISIFWIILGHVYVYSRPPNIVLENIRDLHKQTEDFSMMVITNSFPAVDTFFFLSGLLLMYIVMKKLDYTNGEIHWGKFYLHRFLRLTPAMMFVLLFIVNLEPFVDKGPLWRGHVDNRKYGEYWWTNLLYINNFYPTNVANRSTPTWMWYLAVDMQLFILTPIVIYIFRRYDYRGVVGTSVFLGTGTVICTAAITKHYDIHPMAISLSNSLFAARDAFNYLYCKPYSRINPYLIGLVFGYLMHRKQFRVKQLRWPSATLFWFVAVVVGLTFIYGPFTAFRENPRPWTMSEKILYNTTRGLVWGTLVAWVIYACEYGYGGYVKEFLSAKFWIPLSRLTYSTYLVHVPLINVMYMGYRSSLHYSTHWWAYIYCAVLLLSHGLAFILVVTIEYPCANLEKLLFGKNNRKDHK